MALDVTPEHKAIGTSNFNRTVGKLGVSRRGFLQGMLAAGATAPIGAAAYFGYNAAFGERPVKAGLIGAGDEGGVLVGEHNPRYLEFIAYSDIRPSNQKRIFEGEPIGIRKGFNFHYGSNAHAGIRLYEDYKELLRNPDIEAVVIALPLNMHHQVAMDAMRAGKHVLCEKLMAWNVKQCKEMIKLAEDPSVNRVLSIGHQRHYSMLYAHANEVVKSGVLGDVRHIRAQWHRNNSVLDKDSWRKKVDDRDREYLTDAKLRGFEGKWKNVEQLVRWRLYRETGAGLMAELGSHQLDACSIFLKKVEPLSVTGVGGKHFYTDDREVEDHVYCSFEFPGAKYDKNIKPRDDKGNALHNDIVVVTYSSINTNDFEPYGECLMGSKATLIVEKEESAQLFARGSRSTSVTVAAGGALSTSSTAPSDPGEKRAEQAGQASLGAGIPSRGYREEMEHFAYVIRNRERDPSQKVRCDGRAALKDAVMALVSNIAIRLQKRVVFKPDWFNPGKWNNGTWEDVAAVPEEDPELRG